MMTYKVKVYANLHQCGMAGYRQVAYAFKAGDESETVLAMHSYEPWPGEADASLLGEYFVADALVAADSPASALRRFDEWRRKGHSLEWLTDGGG